MPRIQAYRRIQSRNSAHETGRENKKIGEALGFSKEQVKGFIRRYNRKQEKRAAGISVHRKGRPPKNGYAITEETKSAGLRYLPARKEARVKQLEMENERMRNFLSLTGRKCGQA